MSPKGVDLRASGGFFSSFGNTRRFLVAGGLAASVLVLGAAWMGSSDTAYAARRTSQDVRAGQPGAQRAVTWRTTVGFARPRFRPTMTVDVHTAGQFWRAWNGLRPHEEIDVHGVTFSGEAVFRKRLRGWAEVHFDSRTRFVGTSGANRAAAWIDRCRRIRFYGGDLTNPTGGAGITIYDSSWVTWWNFVVHGTANTGLFVQGIHRPNAHLDLKGQISDWGLNLALDPHSEEGTGLHGANLADSPFGVRDSRFALNLHDGAAGAGVEAGGDRRTDFFAHNTLYLRCRDLTKVAIRATAGNCIQVWGVNVTHNVFRYIEAENLTGRPFETSGMFDGQSLTTNRVVYGRARHTNLNPRVGPMRWDRRFGTVFRHVTPAE
jgi:hypothetical protein